jgi:hypothetical protein
VILSAVLCGYEIWPLLLEEELNLNAFENEVPGKIFTSKSDEVTDECQKFHKEKLNGLYASPDTRITQSRWPVWVGHVL